MEELSGHSDERLLHARERPADSFAVFYRRHVEAILRFAAARGADVETAADVVAETFAIALAKRVRYEPRYETARPWLLGIAARELADAQRGGARERERRRRLAREPIALSAADREGYAALTDGDADVDVEALLAGLPPAQRTAVVGRVIDEQPYAAVAQGLGLSQTATRKAVSRGLAAMRAQLGRHR